MDMETRLKPTWDWILTVMDATEAQLRFGASLTHSTDPSHPLHPLHPLNPAVPPPVATSSAMGTINVLGGASQQRRTGATISEQPPGTSTNTRIVGFSPAADNQRNFDRDGVAQTARREFLTYALSLMRSHSSEHRDSLPVLDVTALRHIAYVLDGIVFYMRSGKENDLDRNDINIWADIDENENDDTEDELQMDNDEFIDSNVDAMAGTVAGQGRRQSFFQRSESTLCLGCPPPDPFNTPMCESLPLADQPHLLQPNARREELFGIPKQPITIPTNGTEAPGVNSPLELPPTMLGLSPHRNINLGSGAASAFVATTSSPGELTAAEVMDMEVSTEATVEPSEETKIIDNVAGPSKPATDETPSNDASTKDATALKRKMPDHPENFGNIYMQLKKKNYYDQYDEDNRNYEKKEGN